MASSISGPASAAANQAEGGGRTAARRADCQRDGGAACTKDARTDVVRGAACECNTVDGDDLGGTASRASGQH